MNYNHNNEPVEAYLDNGQLILTSTNPLPVTQETIEFIESIIRDWEQDKNNEYKWNAAELEIEKE